MEPEVWDLFSWIWLPPLMGSSRTRKAKMVACTTGRRQSRRLGDPYKIPHFVVTHKTADRIDRDGVSFTFVDGIESAAKHARSAANGRPICIAGGASVAQQFLQAGLLDEIRLHVVPVLFGGGLRLFESLRSTKLEQIRVIESPGVTHLQYRVVNHNS